MQVVYLGSSIRSEVRERGRGTEKGGKAIKGAWMISVLPLLANMAQISETQT